MRNTGKQILRDSIKLHNVWRYYGPKLHIARMVAHPISKWSGHERRGDISYMGGYCSTVQVVSEVYVYLVHDFKLIGDTALRLVLRQ